MDIKSPQKVLHIFSGALENFSSFGFVKGRLVCWAKPNVLNVRLARKIKNAGRLKILKTFGSV
jgi:hypothetical protein